MVHVGVGDRAEQRSVEEVAAFFSMHVISLLSSAAGAQEPPSIAMELEKWRQILAPRTEVKKSGDSKRAWQLAVVMHERRRRPSVITKRSHSLSCPFSPKIDEQVMNQCDWWKYLERGFNCSVDIEQRCYVAIQFFRCCRPEETTSLKFIRTLLPKFL